MSVHTLLLIMLVGCGDGATSQIDAPMANPDAAIDGAIDAPPPVTFGLTSDTIVEGGAIPLTHVCTMKGGMNLSPQLAFVDPPQGTQSFVVTLTDLSNGLVHSAIYDIAGNATGLPADVETGYAPADVPGAHQPKAYTGARGYAGPCPGSKHTYRFTAYALATPTLPDAVMDTTKDQVVMKAAAAPLGTGTLTATFTP